MIKKIDIIKRAILTVCFIVSFGLSMNTAYQFGKEQAAGYSEEYLQAYGIFMWAYGGVELPQETASEWAASACNLLVEK